MERGGDRLTDVLERLANQPMLPVPAPQFSFLVKLTERQEYLISRFTEIAEANDWRPAAAMLYLIDSLKEIAENCGRVANVLAIYAASEPDLDSISERLDPCGKTNTLSSRSTQSE